MTEKEALAILNLRASNFLDRFSFDLNGNDFSGGNGGLIVQETINASCQLRNVLLQVQKVLYEAQNAEQGVIDGED